MNLFGFPASEEPDDQDSESEETEDIKSAINAFTQEKSFETREEPDLEGILFDEEEFEDMDLDEVKSRLEEISEVVRTVEERNQRLEGYIDEITEILLQMADEI